MYWLWQILRSGVFTGLEVLVLVHLCRNFAPLGRLHRRWLVGAGVALFVANFAYKPVKWFLYPTPESSALHSFLYRSYITAFFLVGVSALLIGAALVLHYWWERWRIPHPEERHMMSAAHAAPGLTRRAFLSQGLAYGAAGGLSLSTGASAWAVLTSQNKGVDVRRVRVPLSEQHRHLHGLRIAQITDIHVGPFLRGEELEKLLRQVVREGADLIVHTGDHYNMEREYADEGARSLSLLRAPHGAYAVPGNHDRYFGVEKFEAIFEQKGIRVLRASSLEVPGVPGLVLHGINDPESKLPASFPEVDALAKSLDANKFNLLLSHRPEAFDHARGFDLTLAGHTHGGQVRVPLPFGGALAPARLIHPYDWGLFEKEGRRLYVSSGLGYAGPPVRSACPPEIAIIELVYEGPIAA